MLQDKTALIYGGGGAIGGAVARAFADAGARVYLAGRTRARLEKVASDIGDAAGVAEVDALDERAVTEHADAVAADAGGIDIALNAVSFPFVHGTPVRRAGRRRGHASDRRLPADQPDHGPGGGAAHDGAPVGNDPDAVDGRVPVRARREPRVRHHLRGDRGDDPAAGGRARAERRPRRLPATDAIADAPSHGSYTGELFGPRAAAAGVSVEQWLEQWGEDMTLLGRLPTLAQVADAAVFLASDRAAAITGTVVDLTCGNAVRTTAGALVGVLH